MMICCLVKCEPGHVLELKKATGLPHLAGFGALDEMSEGMLDRCRQARGMSRAASSHFGDVGPPGSARY